MLLDSIEISILIVHHRPAINDVLAEYYLMQALQFLTHSQQVTDINYADDSKLSWASLGKFTVNVRIYFSIIQCDFEYIC